MKTLLRLCAAVLFCLLAAPAWAGILWDNGPVNGTLGGFTINGGFYASNSFTLSARSSLTGAEFWTQGYQGDTIIIVDWVIAAPIPTGAGGTSVISGSSPTAYHYLFTDSHGYDVGDVTFSITGVTLDAGSYWFELSNASVPTGHYIFWDVSNGPSAAWTPGSGYLGPTNCPYGSGTTCSEGFRLFGDAVGPTVPEPAGAMLLGPAILLLGLWRVISRSAAAR